MQVDHVVFVPARLISHVDCCGSQLLLGTAERGIKAWNVEAKRVVCDLSTEVSFPR